jgi:hypothetical protein
MRIRRREMVSPRSPREHPFGSEEAFFQAFMKMQSMVEEMYKDRKKAKEESGPSGTTTKVEGEGGDPLESPCRLHPLLVRVGVLLLLL